MSLSEFHKISSRLNNLESSQILKECIYNFFKKKIVYVCSFGSESAILLHMISKIDKDFPIIFINTLKLFDETLYYKELLIAKFGLKNIIELTPTEADEKKIDGDGKLWSENPSKCCEFRKVKLLEDGLNKFTAWFSGRKAYQSYERSKKQIVELQDKRFIISPLIWWREKKIDDYFTKYDLPRHPLFKQGYLSIGCENCTSKTLNASDNRSGRWVGLQKTECGIHKLNNSTK